MTDSSSIRVALALMALVSIDVDAVLAGTYTATINASPIFDIPNAVSHPLGYQGSGGTVQFSICIDDTSPMAAKMVAPLERAVATWQALVPTTGTLVPNPAPDPTDPNDFESAVVHELGHCVFGLDHTTMALPIFATFALLGPNGVLDADAGPDGVFGSKDDDRGDDVNLHWFRRDTNDPFATALPSPIDFTTYARDTDALPAGHSFATNANRAVAGLPGFPPNTEAVMRRRISVGDKRRFVTADDVATVGFAMSGVNQIAGDGDDYVVDLQYLGIVDLDTTPCDLPVRFVPDSELPPGDPLAECEFTLEQIGSTDHFETIPMSIELNQDEPWTFGEAPDLAITKSDGGFIARPGDTIVYSIEVMNVGNLPASGVVITDTVPKNTTFDAGSSDPAWNCGAGTPGTDCTLALPADVDPGDPAVAVTFAVTVDDPISPDVLVIFNFADVTDDGAHGDDSDPSNNSAQDSTPVEPPCAGTENLVLTQPDSEPVVVHEACMSITAGTNYVVGSSQDITFQARRRIVLQDGFAVEAGGVFRAQIDRTAGAP